MARTQVDYQTLSVESKESISAMVDYCLRNGIAMGMDEGIKNFDTNEKHTFRLEIEAFFQFKE